MVFYLSVYSLCTNFEVAVNIDGFEKVYLSVYLGMYIFINDIICPPHFGVLVYIGNYCPITFTNVYLTELSKYLYIRT